MKPAVLCITRSAIDSLKTAEDIKEEDLHFINRNIVDAEDTTVGEMFPQIIPVITIKCGDKYLTYSRNGNETRLHGSRSLSVGGHIDIEDYLLSSYSMRDSIAQSAKRELEEEAGIRAWFELEDFNSIIYNPTNNVSKVHMGVFTSFTLKDESLIVPDEELYDVQFLTKDQLVKDIEQYEDWSQHIINNLI